MRNAPFASRLHAAHLLIGGTNEFPALGGTADREGLFTRPPLSRNGAQALQILRLAAQDPQLIQSNVTNVDVLVAGGAGVLPRDTLRFRLSRLLDEPALATMSADAIYDRLGFDRAELIEARAWLNEEIRTFDRPARSSFAGVNPRGGRMLAPEYLRDGSLSDFPIFAATRLPPERHLAAYWAAMVRYDESLPAAGTTGFPGLWPQPTATTIGGVPAVPFGASWGRETAIAGQLYVQIDDRTSGRTLASLREDSAIRARGLIARLETIGAGLPAIGRAQDILTAVPPVGLGGSGSTFSTGSALTDGTLLGRARVCTRSSLMRVELDLRVSGITSAAGFEVVLGSEALSCAVEGTEDGAPCSAARLLARMPTRTTPFIPVVGTVGRFEATFAQEQLTGPRPPTESGKDPVDAIVQTTAAFVVRREPGLTSPPSPGEYQPIIGFVLPYNRTTTVRCAAAPMTPDLDAEVEDLVAPALTDHGRSETECAGLPHDLLLPLENELTEDGLPHESSWRGYLESAESAAATSDALADELARLELELAMRAEHEADALEELCGVRINSTAFARSLPDRARPLGTGTSCPVGYNRIDVVPVMCVLDPIRYAESVDAVRPADVARLRECIGSTSIAPLLGLGDQPVCLWQTGDDRTTLCRGSSTSQPCPFVVTGATMASQCEPFIPEAEDTRAVFLSGDDLLRLFQVPPEPRRRGGDGGDTPLPCEYLAEVRARRATDPAIPFDDDVILREVLRSGLIHPDTFRRLAGGLGWVPVAGNYSRVTFGRSTVASTGFPGIAIDPEGPALWPAGNSFGGYDVIAEGFCPTATTADPATETRGLFCLGDIPRNNDPTSSTFAEDVRRRAQMNDMLARAVIAARIVAGAGLADEVHVPYYPDAYPDVIVGAAAGPRLTVEDADEISSEAFYYRAYAGSLAIDQPGDEPGATAVDLGGVRAVVEWINGAGSNWSSCAYDGTCRTLDDSLAFAFGEPLIVRRLDDTVDVGDAGPRTGSFFNTTGRTGGALERLLRDEAVGVNGRRGISLFRRVDEEVEFARLADLTRYFRRGAHVGPNLSYGCFNRPGGCPCNERMLACISENEDFDIRSTLDGNQSFIGRDRLTIDDILNGLELVCAVGRIQGPSLDLNCDRPPEDLDSMGDMLRMESFLQCQADAIHESAAATVVTNLPGSVVTRLRESGGTLVGADSGTLAAATSRLLNALLQLAQARDSIADQIEHIGDVIGRLRSVVAASDIAREIEELQLMSTHLGNIASCATALIGANWTNPQSYGGAGAVCGTSAAQSILAQMVSELREDLRSEELRGTFAAFDGEMNGFSTDMRNTALGVRTQINEIDAALAEINSGRNAARRALSRALYLETDAAGVHLDVSSMYRNRYNTTLTRYRQARTRAIRAAYIARRAVEQRIAMPLETITDDLPTVEAPYRWADTLCRIPALDYGRLTMENPESSEGPDGPNGYADTYIGEYVARLREVVTSYSFVFPFHEGTDTAVISLRDDVLGSRASCEVPVPNLVLRSESLHVRPGPTNVGWEPRGCICPAAEGECEVGTPTCCSAGCVDVLTDPFNCGFCGHSCGQEGICDNGSCRCLGAPELCEPYDDPAEAARTTLCVSARPLDQEEEPPFSVPEGAGADFGIATGFELRFGGSAATTSTRLSQDVFLEEGTYRISWYGQPTTSAPDPSGIVAVFDASGAPLLDTRPRAAARVGECDAPGPRQACISNASCAAGVTCLLPAWTRYHHFFSVRRDQTVEVALVPGWSDPGVRRPWIAGLMLEDVSGAVSGDFYRSVRDPSTGSTAPLNIVYQPGAYFGTGETNTRVLSACADIDGAVFRSSWSYGCVRVCPDGYDGDCDDFVATSRCYYQLSIPFDANQIASRLTSTPTGFADGNYNYRVDGLAVNVVGVGVRNCSGGTPGCFSSGNLAYSLVHRGDFPVTNARGETYYAPLFPGRIESARALLAERYLTNPISSADRALIGDYIRLEFAGRPLAGTVFLRIWDEPGLDFERVEDVQLVLNYRYWTHQR